MRILSTILFSALVNGFAFGLESEEQSAISIIDKTGSPNFGFYFIDQFGDLKNHFLFRDTKVAAHYVIHTTSPQIVVLTKGNFSAHPVLIEPGDTCEVSLNSGAYIVKGRQNSFDYSVFSTLEQRLGYIFPDFSGITLSRRLDLLYLLEQHKKVYFARSEFIDNYKKGNALSVRYIEVAQQAIYFKFLRGVLFPFYTQAKGEDLNFTEIPGQYYSEINKILEEVRLNDSLLFLEDYRLFVWNYCRYLSKESLGTPEEFHTLFQNAKINYTGKTRDFIMFYILKKYSGSGLHDYHEHFQYFIENCTVPLYSKAIHQLASYSSNEWINSFKDEVLKMRYEDNIRLGDLIDSYKDKFIYIDFWASWCGPCLQEIPASYRLQAKLKDKNIIFIYISIDHQVQSWNNAIDRYFKGDSNHYLLNPDSPLAKAIGVPPIPRYMIINSAGSISAWQALMPSDPAILQLFGRLLSDSQ